MMSRDRVRNESIRELRVLLGGNAGSDCRMVDAGGRSGSGAPGIPAEYSAKIVQQTRDPAQRPAPNFAARSAASAATAPRWHLRQDANRTDHC